MNKVDFLVGLVRFSKVLRYLICALGLFLVLGNFACLVDPAGIGRFFKYDDGGVYQPIPSRVEFLKPLIFSLALTAFGYISLRWNLIKPTTRKDSL